MADDVILETRGLTKEFKGFVAVKGVSLKVRRGSIHALIGPNGAGKTTCFNLLTHFLEPTSGRIFYKGRDITGSPPARIARMGLVRSFQISAVFPHLTVLENVRVALQGKRGHSFDFWRSARVLNELNAGARELIAAVGLSEFEATVAVELPYGRKRALELATTLERALAAVRQLDGDGGFELGQADRGNQLARAGIELVQHPCRAPEVERMSELSLQRDAHVLEHREVRKYRRDLERAHEAHAGDARRRRAGDVAPLVEDAARGRLQEVRQQVETGGLAGAIGADQGMNAAAPHLEADALDGDEALEFLGEPSGLENDVVGHAHRLGGGRFSMKASIPARPSSWTKAPEITLEASS